ncbi:SAM-dependent methyltransferase [Verrucomicrobia bacterium LW23]|nr:SAM-dependent methyltransferase [Verrucomicrobia bacterium LW23]
MTDALYDYVVAHRSGANDDLVLDDLREETERLGSISRMLVSREQGSLLTLLVSALGVKRAVEVGTFTGYSSVCIARALPADGKLICHDVSTEWTARARHYWERADVAGKIELRLGPAVETLRCLANEPEIDFAFIDANKDGYDSYYELILPRLKQNGIIIFDNMLWGGRLVTEEKNTVESIAVDQLNRKLAGDERVEAVLIPVADGLNIVRKK